MKIVEFTKDMLPRRAGETQVVPDDIAARLHAAGEVKEPMPFPPADVAPASPATTTRRGRYQTRAR